LEIPLKLEAWNLELLNPLDKKGCADRIWPSQSRFHTNDSRHWISLRDLEGFLAGIQLEFFSTTDPATAGRMYTDEDRNSESREFVAQSFTLLYRRVALGRLLEIFGGVQGQLPSQNAILRYSRVKLCATFIRAKEVPVQQKNKYRWPNFRRQGSCDPAVQLHRVPLTPWLLEMEKRGCRRGGVFDYAWLGAAAPGLPQRSFVCTGSPSPPLERSEISVDESSPILQSRN
jgi:hypothetical protein